MFFRKPCADIQITASNEDGLEKALANLQVANVHYLEATHIIEAFIRDFREKQRVNEQ